MYNFNVTFEKNNLIDAFTVLDTAGKNSLWTHSASSAPNKAALIHRLATTFTGYGNDKFTRVELVKALESPVGFNNPIDAASAVVSRIRNERKTQSRRMAAIKMEEEQEETFTSTELVAALNRVTSLSSTSGVKWNSAYFSRTTMAMDLIRNIKTHREPQYENGTVVSDAKNDFYRRVISGWEKFGSVNVFAYTTPVRPLTVQFNKDNAK
jgi:hypothetical protein